jgi:hypothetical protein
MAMRKIGRPGLPGLQRVLEEKFGKNAERLVSVLCDLVAHSDPKVKLDAVKLVLAYQVGMPSSASIIVAKAEAHARDHSITPRAIGRDCLAPQLPAPVVTEIPAFDALVIEPAGALPSPAFDIVEALLPPPPPVHRGRPVRAKERGVHQSDRRWGHAPMADENATREPAAGEALNDTTRTRRMRARSGRASPTWGA